MATLSLEAGLPEVVLPGGTVIRFEAIDPSTGASYTDVVVRDIAIYGYDVSGATGELQDLVPYLASEELAGGNV